MANLLSLSRLALALPFGWLVLASSEASAWLLAWAVASDLVDGPIARRRGGTSGLGRLLDHGADFAFVSAGLWAAAARSALTPLLPLLVCVAFAQYFLDSRIAGRFGELRPNALGRWNGVLYFVPLGGVCLADAGVPALQTPASALAWLLVASTALSIGARLRALTGARRTARAVPAEGTGARSPR